MPKARDALTQTTAWSAQSSILETSKPLILIVDGEEINRKVLKSILRSEPYRILEASRISDASAILKREPVDLVILDLTMPGTGGFDFCRKLKSERSSRFIPILALTSVQSVEHEIAGIESGADEFLLKPLHPAIVRSRIAAMVRQKAMIDCLEEDESILFTLARAIEQRDSLTGDHCERLATIGITLGIALGLGRAELIALHRGGVLHDIGKIGIPDKVLHKPGPLTETEWQIMRAHTIRGEEICRPLKSLSLVVPIIRSHHERWDGSGYPDGLRGEEIPLLARILQIADIYDALTSVRPYKAALCSQEAIAILDEETRRGWRDPELVTLFRQLWSESGEALDRAANVRISLENLRAALQE